MNNMLTAIGQQVRFDYTGNYQVQSLLPGRYKITCAGAQGGYGYGNVHQPGEGGITSGILEIQEPMDVYAYVGEYGIHYQYSNMGFNGGGAAFSGEIWHKGGRGGGASDIRLIPGSWNDQTSLKSRVIVAGGGGGGMSTCSGYYATTGHGGGLTGAQSFNTASYYGSYSNGGTQDSGGTSYSRYYNNPVYGSFGTGAYAGTCAAGGGGGGTEALPYTQPEEAAVLPMLPDGQDVIHSILQAIRKTLNSLMLSCSKAGIQVMATS